MAMPEEIKTETAEVKEADVEVSEPVETETDTETETKEEKIDNEIDYDAEIAKEKGKPDPEKAKEAFKARQEKHQETVDDEEKPLTRKDLLSLRAEVRSEVYAERASELAASMATNDKERELLVERWKNWTFPENTTLTDQMEAIYAFTHRKRLIGERNEALRALKNKAGTQTNSATTHRDAPRGSEPKISPAEAQAFKAAGYVWNGTSRNYEKKLPNGDLLVRDSKTKQTRVIKKAK